MQKLKEIPELVFKGMNDREKPESLSEGYLALIKNGLIGDQQIKKGPGTVTLFNIGTSKRILGGIATSTEIYVALNEPGDSLAFIYRYTGSGNPVVVSSANLTADRMVDFVDTGDAVYVLNGTDPTGKLVGSTYTQPVGMPIGSFGKWYNNRLYILTTAGVLHYSDANAPETFGGSSNIEIFPSQNSPATGISSVGGVLVIGKRDNIITFNGFTEDDFTVKSLNEALPNYGVTSHRSMVNTGDDLYFMSFAGDVPHIRSLKRTSFDKLNYGGIISGAIEGTMRNVNKNRLERVAGGFDGRYIWWSLPQNTSIDNDLVICKDTFMRDPDDGWTVHDTIRASVWFRSTITGDDRLYYGSDDARSKVYSINDAVSSRDEGEFDFEVKSRAYRPKTYRKSKFKYVYITTGDDNNSGITVEGSPDGFTFEEQDIISPDVASSVFPMTFPFFLGSSSQKKSRVNLGGNTNAYTYQLRFTESSGSGNAQVFPFTFPFTFGTDSKISIKEWSVMQYARGLRDA